jgi:hypothetical protein
MTPFDFVNSINDTKTDLIVDDATEKQYNAFIVNRSLSYFADTVLFANEMNRLAHTDNKLQYDFLRHGIRKRKRFSKWNKNVQPEDLSLIKDLYKYNNETALSALSLMNSDQVKQLKEKAFTGGRHKLSHSKQRGSS